MSIGVYVWNGCRSTSYPYVLATQVCLCTCACVWSVSIKTEQLPSITQGTMHNDRLGYSKYTKDTKYTKYTRCRKYMCVCKLGLLFAALVFLSSDLAVRDTVFIRFTIVLNLLIAVWTVVYELWRYYTAPDGLVKRTSGGTEAAAEPFATGAATLSYTISTLAITGKLCLDLWYLELASDKARVYRRIGLLSTVLSAYWIYTFEVTTDTVPTPGGAQDAQARAWVRFLYVAVSAVFVGLWVAEPAVFSSPVYVLLPSVQTWANIVLLAFLPPYIFRSGALAPTHHCSGNRNQVRVQLSTLIVAKSSFQGHQKEVATRQYIIPFAQ